MNQLLCMAKSCMRKITVAALGALLLTGAVGAPVFADSQTYDIDVLMPVTGNFAMLGATFTDGFKAAEKNINATGGIHGRPVHFVFLDDQTNPIIDVQLVAPIIQKKVPIVFDAGGVAGCKAIEPLIAANGPVLYCLSPAFFPAANSYGFALASQDDGVHAIFNFIRAKRWTRVAIMTPTNADGQNADRAFAKYLALPENKALQAVAYEHFNPTDISVSAQLTKIRQASPDAFLAWGSGALIGTVYRSMKEVGYDVPTLGSISNFLYGQLDQFKGILPRDYYMYAASFARGSTLPKGPQRDAVMAMMRTANDLNIKPDLGIQSAWDAAQLIASKLRELPENATALQLRDALLKTHGYSGIDGIYDFRDGGQRGLGLDSFVIVRWDDVGKQFVAVTGPGGLGRP